MDANGWLVVCALGKKDDADAQLERWYPNHKALCFRVEAMP